MGRDDVLLFMKSTTLRGFRVATFPRKTLPFHKMPNVIPVGLYPTGTLNRKKGVLLGTL